VVAKIIFQPTKWTAERKGHLADRIVTLNLGLGRDSSAMVCLLAEGELKVKLPGSSQLYTLKPTDIDVAVFADTGREWDYSYQAIPQLTKILTSLGIPFIQLKRGSAQYYAQRKGLGNSSDPFNLRTHPAKTWAEITQRAQEGAYHYNYADIMADYAARSTTVSLQSGDCTTKHKIAPIRRFLNDLAVVRFGVPNRKWARGRKPHLSLIGIANDERSRVFKKNGEPKHKGLKYIQELYPLIDMELNKPDEAKILKRCELAWVRKSGCYICPYQPISHYWALSVLHPDIFAKVEAYEQQSLKRNPNISITGTKIGGKVLPIRSLVTRWRQANPKADVQKVLDKTYSRCTPELKALRRQEQQQLAAGTTQVLEPTKLSRALEAAQLRIAVIELRLSTPSISSDVISLIEQLEGDLAKIDRAPRTFGRTKE